MLGKNQVVAVVLLYMHYQFPWDCLHCSRENMVLALQTDRTNSQISKFVEGDEYLGTVAEETLIFNVETRLPDVPAATVAHFPHGYLLRGMWGPATNLTRGKNEQWFRDEFYPTLALLDKYPSCEGVEYEFCNTEIIPRIGVYQWIRRKLPEDKQKKKRSKGDSDDSRGGGSPPKAVKTVEPREKRPRGDQSINHFGNYAQK
jgi:hypothetical protein